MGKPRRVCDASSEPKTIEGITRSSPIILRFDNNSCGSVVR
jgi:hypothetical protein